MKLQTTDLTLMDSLVQSFLFSVTATRAILTHVRRVDQDHGSTSLFRYLVDSKPEGIAAELADVLIRIADTCARYDIPLEEAILKKQAYNRTRSHRHGGKKA